MKQINFYMNELFMMLILVLIMVLMGVAYLTLMERKFLSYIQMRKGPNKLGYMGLVQPFSDAIKLMFKEVNLMNKMNMFLYTYSPVVMFILIMMMWMIYPFWYNLLSMQLGLFYLLCCLSFSVYSLLMSGWSSNSSYSMLGSIRSMAQSISYEVSLAIILIIPMMLGDTFCLGKLYFIQKMGSWLIFCMWPLSLMFLFSMMAELNRTPFDFSEGESELVSGFNVEYGSVGFILIFLSEYSSILFLSFLFSMMYLGGDYMSLMFFIKILFISYLIIWIRGSFPRFRYDLLMSMCWLMILPFSLNYMVYVIFLKIYMICK